MGRAYCRRGSMPFHIGDSSLCRFWYPQGVPEILRDNLSSGKSKGRHRFSTVQGLVPLTLMLFKGQTVFITVLKRTGIVVTVSKCES